MKALQQNVKVDKDEKLCVSAAQKDQEAMHHSAPPQQKKKSCNFLHLTFYECCVPLPHHHPH